MTGIAILIVGVTAYILVVHLVLRPLKRRRKHQELIERFQEEPFPAEWDDYLTKKFELYPKLPPDLRSRLQFQTRVMMEEKFFESPADLGPVTDEMRLLILAQAALLTVGRRPKRFFPELVTIILYPTAYLDSGSRTFSLREDSEHRLGESWTTGSVVLAWDSVQLGAVNEDDGQNVVLHEFAHQLDQEDGRGDGVPILSDPSEYGDWAKVFSHRYTELVEDTEKGRKTFLDAYGAVNPAEFFAVSTETFFEQSATMKRKLPELHQELVDYYGLDPATWK
ncbi:MAG: M90 family metallopeptidase [Verrucomicrobiota bacterium]